MTDKDLAAALTALHTAAGKADAGPLLDWAVGIVDSHITAQEDRIAALLRLCTAAEAVTTNSPHISTAVIRAALETP